jgi:hypothetical protein
MNPHKLLLLTVLGLAAAALAYNAYSILRGEPGLTGLSSHPFPEQTLPSRQRLSGAATRSLPAAREEPTKTERAGTPVRLSC